MITHAASLILAGLIEAEGGVALLTDDDLCPSNLRGVIKNKPYKVFVAGAQPGDGAHRWRISVPTTVLDDEQEITIIGAIKASPMTCTFIFMPRIFLKLLGTQELDLVTVGLSVNPYKGGFVTDGRPWPIIQETANGFPPEPVPQVGRPERQLPLTLQ
jgi:hypothetical protein